MGLETANYIADLVTTNPLSGDLKNQGDDHIRMLKDVLKNTFPGLGGRFHRISSKSVGYTIVTTDFSVAFNCTSALTLSLTAAATIGNGFCCAVYASGGAVVLDPSGTEKINGALTYTLPQGCFGMLFCDGTGWMVMSNYIPLSQLEYTGIAGQVLTSAGIGTAPSMQNLPVFVPTGAVMPFAMNSVPFGGWLACDGTAVSRSLYTTLFAAIGTLYGVGDGTTTFNLPDLRGYFVRGFGTNSDGTVSGAFGAQVVDSNKIHTHSGTTGAENSSLVHAHGLSNVWGKIQGLFQPGSSDGAKSGGTNLSDYNGPSAHTHNFTTGDNSDGGTESRPKNIAMLYCIKT